MLDDSPSRLHPSVSELAPADHDSESRATIQVQAVPRAPMASEEIHKTRWKFFCLAVLTVVLVFGAMLIPELMRLQRHRGAAERMSLTILSLSERSEEHTS